MKGKWEDCETQCLQADFRANTPAKTAFTWSQAEISGVFGPLDAVKHPYFAS